MAYGTLTADKADFASVLLNNSDITIRMTLSIALSFLGTFAKLLKATIIYVKSVCPSVCLYVRMEQLGCRRTNFHELSYLGMFRKYVENIQVSLKSDKNNTCFTWRPVYSTFMLISDWILLRARNVSDIICTKSQNTHFIFKFFFFQKSSRLWDNVEKYCRTREATDDNITWRMRIASWIMKATNTHSEYVMLLIFLCNSGYTMRLSVTLYVHSLSCF